MTSPLDGWKIEGRQYIVVECKRAEPQAERQKRGERVQRPRSSEWEREFQTFNVESSKIAFYLQGCNARTDFVTALLRKLHFASLSLAVSLSPSPSSSSTNACCRPFEVTPRHIRFIWKVTIIILPSGRVFYPRTNLECDLDCFYFRVPVYLPAEAGGNSTASVIASNVTSDVGSANVLIPPQNLGQNSHPCYEWVLENTRNWDTGLYEPTETARGRVPENGTMRPNHFPAPTIVQ